MREANADPGGRSANGNLARRPSWGLKRHLCVNLTRLAQVALGRNTKRTLLADGCGYFRTTAKYLKTNKLGSFDRVAAIAWTGDMRIKPVFVSIPAFGLRQFSLVTQDGFRELVGAVQ